GDGGHLTQQAQGVEAALLDRARRPRQLRGPAELALDLLDELADLGGGGLRLLPLDADEGDLVLLLIEQNVHNAVGHPGDTDPHKQRRLGLGEQAGGVFGGGGCGRRLLGRVSAGVLTRLFATQGWLICGHPVPAEPLRPDDQTRSVWCRTPRTPWQSPSRARLPAHVRTKR